MKRILTAVLVIAFLTAGCASATVMVNDNNRGTAVTTVSSGGSANEVKYYPTYDPSYKTARNDIFDFWFDIPADWKAVDKSADGSTFAIISDDPGIELNIFGTSAKKSDEDFFRQLSGGAGSIEDFTFNDGWVGKKIAASDSKVYYVRVDGDTYICFSIDYGDKTGWYEDNADKLDYIAKSLRTRQGSFGNIGEGSKITMDDLQLGVLKLNTPYKQVLEVMKSKPDREEDSSDDGIQSKTMFFADGTEVYLVDGVVNSIDVIDKGYATPRGLKVGDGTSRIKELYGDPDVTDSTHWGYKYDGYELFTIVIKNSVITEMEVDLVM